MQKKGQLANTMITLSVMVIIGIVILGIVFVFLQGTTQTVDVSESVTTTLEQFTALGNQNIIASSLVVTNGTNGTTDVVINVGNYTLDAPPGLINVSNQTDTNPWPFFDGVTGTLVYNYTYVPGEFVTNSTARTLIDLIPLMFAIVILIGVLVIGGIAFKNR